ncbi:Type I inositol 1,4,5-trisphosphate 5-phosphatase [Sparganum proliferum]
MQNHDQQTSLLRNIFEVIEVNRPAFVAVHLQEISGKKFQSLPKCTENFIKSILETVREEGFTNSLVVLDDSPDAATHTFFTHGLDNCSLVKKRKFERKGSGGRKGLLQTRWRLGNMCLDFVNVHLFNDNNNLITVKNFPHDLSVARMEKLGLELTSLQEVPFIIFGDFNFRLNQPKLLEALFQRYLATKADALIECLSSETEIVYRDSSTQSHLLTVHRKHLDFGPLKPLLLPLLNQARCFDEEPGPFEGSLFEYPIQFRPSYPFSEDPSKPSEYASSRFPAWCDRVFISRSALSLLDIRDAVYGLLCEDVSVGDHKPVFLQLTLADDAFTVNQDQRKIDELELVTKNDKVVSQERALE